MEGGQLVSFGLRRPDIEHIKFRWRHFEGGHIAGGAIKHSGTYANITYLLTNAFTFKTSLFKLLIVQDSAVSIFSELGPSAQKCPLNGDRPLNRIIPMI